MTSVTIYVFMPEEGVDVWRPVDAELVSPGVYRITSPDPDAEVEVWEFRSGDVVRCELRRLDDGEQLVAVAKADEPRVMLAIEGERISPDLPRLLLAVFHALAGGAFDAAAIALERCFRFLSSPIGRTNANCVAADLFFCLKDRWAMCHGTMPRPVFGMCSTTSSTDSTTQSRLPRSRGTSRRRPSSSWRRCGRQVT